MADSRQLVYNSLEDLACNNLANFLTEKTVELAKDLQRNEVLKYISRHPEDIEIVISDYVMCLFSHYVGQAFIRISKSGLKCMIRMIGKIVVGDTMASAVEDISKKELFISSQYISHHICELISELYANGIITEGQVSELSKRYIKSNHADYALMPITLTGINNTQSIYRTLKSVHKDILNDIFHHKYSGYKFLESPFKGDCYRYLMFNIDGYSFSV